MDAENKATTQAEFASNEWVPISVTQGKLVMRGGHSCAEELLIRQARERLSQHDDTVRVLEEKGWTVGDVHFLRSGTLDADLQMRIEASVLVEGYEVTYSLIPEGDEWAHHFEGLGVEFGVYLDVLAPRVASPETALRLLRETDEWHRSYLRSAAYGYLLAHCGPGEEPDPGEVERLCEWSHRAGALPSDLDQEIVDYDPDRDHFTGEDVPYAVKCPTETGG